MRCPGWRARGAPQRPSRCAGTGPASLAAALRGTARTATDRCALGRHAHLRVLRGNSWRSRPAICSGRVAPLQILLHLLSQRQVGGQLRWLGPPRRARRRQRVRGRRAIRLPAAAGVTPKLAARSSTGCAQAAERSLASTHHPHAPARSPRAQRTTNSGPSDPDHDAGAPHPPRPTTRAPFLRVPASAAASVMNDSPRCMAAQNRCTTSVTIRSENRRHRRLRSPHHDRDEPLPNSHPPSSDRQRADRRGRLALGLGFATTGALLNHGGRTGQEVPRSAGCCDHRENPRDAERAHCRRRPPR